MPVVRLAPFVIAATLPLGSPAPAHADGAEYSGLTCGMVSTNDESGFIQQNPDVQFGLAVGGPWTAVDALASGGAGISRHPGAVDIEITCTVQVNNPAAGGTAAASVSGTGGAVALTVGQIVYSATATDNVYLCTRVQMTHGGTVGVYVFDADGDPRNGDQCELALSLHVVSSMHVVTPSVVCGGEAFAPNGLCFR